jgi:hypothetical protein
MFSSRKSALILFVSATLCVSAHTQLPLPPSTEAAQTSASAEAPPKPIPDIVALMRDVEANQRKSEAVQKDYIYHSSETRQEFDSHGQTKKTSTAESDHFWINGVPVRRTLSRDGKSLTADELAKENQRIDQRAADAAAKREHADAQGKETDPRGNEEVTVSRLLELGSFSNPRRVQLNGRDTIAVDFTGDPKAKTRDRAEEIIRVLAGTAWIDEQDHVLSRAEGHFFNAFKIAGGLVASVQKDTRFTMQLQKINDEVWLPVHFSGQGSFHALLFFGFNGSAEIVNSDFRKFRATSTILPGTSRVPDATGTPAP